ncbi:MAG: thermonuclease family protein [Chloroflexota bacterium]|jgi:endonuclease YncB( thermonuclease family)
MRRIILTTALFIASIIGTLVANTVPAHAAEQCFVETGYCIDGRIAEFWNKQGGLSVFGFPIGPAETITVDGKQITQQNFERQRIEYHPSNAKPYDILLGRLGADVLAGQGRDWFAFGKSGNQPGCMYFAQTDQSVCGLILERWKATGVDLDGRRGLTDAERLALHGLPLSGLVTETLSDGRQYQVQWFERTRIELHPQNQPPYNVQQGLLGRELSVPAPVAAPAPQSQPAAQAPAPSTSAANIPAGSAKATVTRVVDGDTIRVNLDGKEVTIRMIGLDTPETKDPRKPVQCYGQEASNKATQLLDGQIVYLEVDPTQGTYDAYQRLLSYVWLSDGRLFNQLMIDEGYAFEYTYNKPYKYQAAFKNAQRTAREQQRGLWSPATCNGVASPVASGQTGSGDTAATTDTSGANTSGGSATSAESYPCAVNQIKGNVNSGIYHVPGGASYAKTTANVQCFNTEAEAVTAGFKRAKR